MAGLHHQVRASAEPLLSIGPNEKPSLPCVLKLPKLSCDHSRQ